VGADAEEPVFLESREEVRNSTPEIRKGKAGAQKMGLLHQPFPIYHAKTQ